MDGERRERARDRQAIGSDVVDRWGLYCCFGKVLWMGRGRGPRGPGEWFMGFGECASVFWGICNEGHTRGCGGFFCSAGLD